ncbi:MAG: hypothetical protein ACMG6E_05480, partial [Candidatus Roizmanbacteria bacterium]
MEKGRISLLLATTVLAVSGCRRTTPTDIHAETTPTPQTIELCPEGRVDFSVQIPPNFRDTY